MFGLFRTAQENIDASRKEHVVPGREMHMKDMRGYRFCEVGLITGTTKKNAVGNVWNTTGTSDPTPEQFAVLDAETIAKENHAPHAWLNPVRRWMFDELDIWEVGEDRQFDGLKFTWAAVAGAEAGKTVQRPFAPGHIYRNNAFTFKKGSEVYLLDAPDGEVFVLQSFTQAFDPSLSKDNLAELGDKLTLPDGWAFRSKVLDRDLRVSTHESSEHMAQIVQDNLHNTYQGSDGGKAFTYIP
jgi:haloalkane dehalogenase